MSAPAVGPSPSPRGRATDLGTALDSGRDNFALLRLALALAVVVSHAGSVVSGRVDDEPLHALTGYTLGEHAVNGFFAVSGFLVAGSLERRGPLGFLRARAARVVPGLVVAALVVALVLGPALTRLPVGAYLADAGTWRFLALTLGTLKGSALLPGLFEANPLGFPMGTVWTLKYELICYGALALAGALGLARRAGAALALAALLGLGLLLLGWLRPDAGKAAETWFRLPMVFALGVALHRHRARVPASVPLALGALAVAAALVTTPAYRPALFAAEAFGVVALALDPRAVLARLQPGWDLSYGAYLYGWPAQQALRALLPGTGPLALLAPSIAVALALAALSWRYVERPALRFAGGARRRAEPLASAGR